MTAKSYKIVFHHHANAFVDESGAIFLQSFIAKWINELAKHVEKIGLLLYTTNVQTNSQDVLLEGDNITLHSLGNRNQNVFLRQRLIKNVCKQIEGEYNVLLIRGITPAQYTVWKNCSIDKKVFLLVGSLMDSQPKLSLSRVGILTYLIYRLRIQQLNKMSKQGTLLVNSPKIISEVKRLMNKNAYFVPTNTISTTDIRPLHVKEIGRPVRLFFCGRVVKDKGIFELLKAVYILNNEGIACNLVIVGNVNNQMMTEIESLNYYNDISSQIQFVGYIKYGEELFNYYDSSDIYILPSYHEGFPHSIWESIAVSTPIIVTDVGGIRGIVNDEHVLFIKSHSSEEIVKGVKTIIWNIQESQLKVRQAYKLLEEYTVEKCATRLLQQISDV
jgi:glycosyltransferase involved in cell wall biosynthesis